MSHSLFPRVLAIIALPLFTFTLSACGGGGGSPDPLLIPKPSATAMPPGVPVPSMKPSQAPSPSSTPTVNPGTSPLPTGTPTPLATTTPTVPATASPTPIPGSVVLNPTSLSFTAVGSTYAQSVAISETNYAGGFSTTDTCAGTATVSAVTNSSFTVTPMSAGSCNVTVADSNGKTAILPVTVTTTTVTVR